MTILDGIRKTARVDYEAALDEAIDMMDRDKRKPAIARLLGATTGAVPGAVAGGLLGPVGVPIGLMATGVPASILAANKSVSNREKELINALSAQGIDPSQAQHIASELWKGQGGYKWAGSHLADLVAPRNVSEKKRRELLRYLNPSAEQA